jgi:DNA-binding PadR family transcriptional regulator
VLKAEEKLGTTKERKEPTNKMTKGYSQREIETRVVKNFLDIIILIEMKKQSGLSGYDVIAFVNETFGGMMSPGTVYATLYSIERKGLIKGVPEGRKTVYKLTDEGREVITQMMTDFNKAIGEFAQKFLMI